MPDWILEWIGYAASLIVLISLLMRSVKRLRWINLIGSLIFAVYGFLIGSLPVGFMNVGIALINIYYLVEMYRQKDYFIMLETQHDDAFLKHFKATYQSDIDAFIREDDRYDAKQALHYLMLRNTVPAGLFILMPKDDQTLMITCDYATPMFRDFKLGHFIYQEKVDHFKSQGYKRFTTHASNPSHASYLKKMGFNKIDDQTFQKEI